MSLQRHAAEVLAAQQGGDGVVDRERMADLQLRLQRARDSELDALTQLNNQSSEHRVRHAHPYNVYRYLIRLVPCMTGMMMTIVYVLLIGTLQHKMEVMEAELVQCRRAVTSLSARGDSDELLRAKQVNMTASRIIMYRMNVTVRHPCMRWDPRVITHHHGSVDYDCGTIY